MSTPTEPDAPASSGSAYAPPYGSAPAYGDRGYDAGYGGTPTYGAPHGDTAVLPPPPAKRSVRSRGRGPAALLLACLLSGGVGGVVAHALDDDPVPATTTSSASGAVITRDTGGAPAAAPAGTTQAAAATISPSVVTIGVTGQQASSGGFGQTRSQPVSGSGSGIVLRPDGFIVTNNHVVALAAGGGGSVSVTFSDGSTVPATIVGTDASSDLAVIKVDRQGLTPAVFANSDELAVGQPVLAVGAPLGLSNTVTEGIVSTLNRPVRTGEEGATEQSVIDAVQTDAAINPGNSGGALVDLAGRVVGVNSAIATTGDGSSQSGNIGVGFAIPSNDVVETTQQLIQDGRATHAQIGISAGDASGTTNGTPGGGAVVQAVSAGGPAASAGLQQGDVITRVDDRQVTDADSLIVAIRSHKAGDRVTVTYQRDGSTATATATLVEAPSS